MQNVRVVSANFWPRILGNVSIVLIFFLNKKSNRCFNRFLAVDFSQSIRSFNVFFKWKIESLFQEVLGRAF